MQRIISRDDERTANWLPHDCIKYRRQCTKVMSVVYKEKQRKEKKREILVATFLLVQKKTSLHVK
jgi:hypothetical protein